MNQILDHSGPKKKKAPSNSNDIKSIIRVFAIIMIIFGISLVVSGTYTFANNNKLKNASSTPTTIPEPTIIAENQDETTVKITVSHSKTIERVVYRWDDLESTTQKGRSDQTELTIENIGIPTGEHTLTVEVYDIDRNMFSQTYTFSCAEGNDVIDPTIDIVIEGTRIEIVAEDETELQYVTYKIGENEEQTLYPEDDPKRVSEVLELELTETTDISVTAVDTANNEAKKTSQIVIYEKPEISFSATSDYSEIIATITSGTPLTRIEVTFNGQTQTIDITDGATTYEHRQQVTQPGRNDISITAYTNIEGEEVSQTAEGYVNYGQ